jgi:O-antigen/teichoic acid export membrane protein
VNIAAARIGQLLAWRPGGYLCASGLLFAWLAVRALAQTALFVLVARTLGAEGYGSLIAVMAVATFFAPLAGLGGQAIMLRDGARNPQALPVHLGDALRLWAISVVPLCVVAFLACLVLVPTALPGYATAAIVLADVAGASLLELLARTWQAVQRMGGFGAAMAGLIVVRLAAFCTLLGVAAPTPAQWAVWYCVITAVYIFATAALVARIFGRPRPSRTALDRLIRAGFPFAFAGSAMRVQAEANKPILARLDTLASAGAFSAGQRIIDILILPIQATIAVIMPAAYRAPNLRAIFTLALRPFAFALFGGVVVLMSAPWIPLILGATYIDTVHVTYLLAFLPSLVVIRSHMTTALAAQNKQRYFYLTHSVGAISGVISALVLVTAYGSAGAALSAYIPEVVIIIIQALLFFAAKRDISRESPP